MFQPSYKNAKNHFLTFGTNANPINISVGRLDALYIVPFGFCICWDSYILALGHIENIWSVLFLPERIMYCSWWSPGPASMNKVPNAADPSNLFWHQLGDQKCTENYLEQAPTVVEMSISTAIHQDQNQNNSSRGTKRRLTATRQL